MFHMYARHLLCAPFMFMLFVAAPRAQEASPADSAIAPASDQATSSTNAIPFVDPETIFSKQVAEIQTLVALSNDVDALVLAHQTLILKPDHLELLRLNGGIQRRLKDYAGARTTYEHIITLDPDDLDAPSMLALILQEIARKARDAEALELLERSIGLVDRAPGPLLDYVKIASKLEKHAKAASAFERIPPELQDDTDLLRAAAASYGALKALEQATALYEKVVALDPSDTQSARRMVELLRDSGRKEAALEKLNDALESDPENIILLLLKAEISAEEGEVWSELRSLARITRLRPGNRDAINRQVDRLIAVGCVGLASEIAAKHSALLSEDLAKRVESLARIRAADLKTIDDGLPTIPPEKRSRPVFLAYGDVRWSTSGTAEVMDVPTFIRQVEYLRSKRFTFVSPIDISAAQRGKRALPEKSVMLMFNSGYTSFSKNVLPLLDIYDMSAVVAIHSSAGTAHDATSGGNANVWEDLASVGAHPRVTLASMTHALGSHVRVNPQGRLALAATSRRYDPHTEKYETATEYYTRVDKDLRQSVATILRKTGKQVEILVWPEGAFSSAMLTLAQRADFMMMFGARMKPGKGPDKRVMPQRPVPGDLSLAEFARRVQAWAIEGTPPPDPIRAMPVNLDAISLESPEETQKHVTALIARVIEAGVNTAIVRAYDDPRGTRNAKKVYFPNSVLPVKHDLLSHVTALLRYRGIRVFVSMPGLSVTPPDLEHDDRYFVMEYRWGRVQPMSEWNRRLSPFHERTLEVMKPLYEELATSVECDGYLIENDVYLSDSEDFSPAAAQIYRDELEIRERNPEYFSKDQKKKWTERKRKQLEKHIDILGNTITRIRPHAMIGRTVHAATLWDPKAEEWLGQNFARALQNHDFIVIPVSPETYKAQVPVEWVSELGGIAAKHHGGKHKTVFAVEVRNPDSQRWLSRHFWKRRVDALLKGGASHISYYPDMGIEDDQPDIQDVRSVMISTGSEAEKAE